MPRPSDKTLKLLRGLFAILVLAALLAGLGANSHLLTIHSSDGPWHLSTGRLIIESGSVPRADPFCFPNEGVDWVNLNWLAQAGLYKLYQAFGLRGPALASIFTAALLVLFTLANLRRRRISPMLGIVAATLAIAPVLGWMSLRPRSWTFALTALFLWLLVPERTEDEVSSSQDATPASDSAAAVETASELGSEASVEGELPDLASASAEETAASDLASDGPVEDASPDPGSARPTTQAPPPLGIPRAALLLGVLAVWNHLHGGFVFGYALLALDALGSGIMSLRRDGRCINRRSVELVTVIAGGLLLLVLTHPHGFAAIEHVADYQARVAGQRGFIRELNPPDFKTPPGRIAEICLIGFMLCALRLDWRERLTLLVFAHFQLAYSRFLLVTPFVFLPILATQAETVRCAWFMPDRVRRLWRAGDDLFSLAWRALPGTALTIALITMIVTPLQPGPHIDPENQFALRDIVEAIVRQPKKGRMFNDWSLGGRLTWELGPRGLTFIDGRGDLHERGPGFKDFRAMMICKGPWREKLEDYDIQFVAYLTDSPLVRTLILADRWQILFSDPVYTLLHRPADWSPEKTEARLRRDFPFLKLWERLPKDDAEAPSDSR